MVKKVAKSPLLEERLTPRANGNHDNHDNSELFTRACARARLYVISFLYRATVTVVTVVTLQGSCWKVWAFGYLLGTFWVPFGVPIILKINCFRFLALENMA
jgi:hypothetical protein